jgi:hypothetical protein
MTKNFRKNRKFETLRFVQDFERQLIEDTEGDVFTLTPLERGKEFDDADEELYGKMEA